jgi:alkanesulfonate monooxygenase SsuD/methylene tetrahydromethanopterin reductase-like flavin-dependent oxidoreductase (luciferase family)
VSYAFGIGHRRAEYEHFGLEFRRRGRLADEKLDLLRQLLVGEPVVFDGRRIHITPACRSSGGPLIMVAGGSGAAVKRAARHGLGVVLQTNRGGLKQLYENE